MVGRRSTGAFPKLTLMCDGEVICARRCMEWALTEQEMVGREVKPPPHETSGLRYIGAVSSQGRNPLPLVHIVV